MNEFMERLRAHEIGPKRRQRVRKPADMLVDDDCKWLVEKFHWVLDRYGYAITRAYFGEPGRKKQSHILFHRVIANALPGQIVDHINRNKLDNRRANLRIVTPHESARNRSPISTDFIGMTGVAHVKDVSYYKYRAFGNFNRKHYHLGCFSTAETAAEVSRAWSILNVPGAVD